MEKKTGGKRSIVRITAIFFVVALLCSGLLSPVYGADHFETRRYDVDIHLAENYTFEVCETIDVEFSQPRHGLIRDIPYRGMISRKVDGKVVKEAYRMKISQVRVDGRPFQTFTENGVLGIQIGKESEYVDGPQRYVIRYKCTVYENPAHEAGDDYFYWNVLPHDWPTAIEAGQLTIHMPKDFAAEKAEFIGGKYGAVDMEAVDWEVDGRVITGNLTRALEEREGVTVNVPLSEGYFSGQKNLQWMIALMVLLVFAAGLSTLVLWLRYGKNKRIMKTVEFYPPEGVNSAEAGYLIHGSASNKQLVSLLIYWANKGYLEVREEGTKSKKFTLIKKQALPDTSSTYEVTMFRGLFRKGDVVESAELKEEFYPHLQAAKGQLIGHFTRKKENHVYTKSSKIAQIVNWVLMPLILLLPPVMGLFYIFTEDALTVSVIVSLISFVFPLFFLSLVTGMKKVIELKWLRVFFLLGQGFMFLLYASMTALLAHSIFGNVFIAVPVVISALISLICTTHMKKRTEKNRILVGQILGFQEFIKIAELDRIKRLVEENPTYFFDILPYAYVFDLTDKWVKKFETIAMPSPTWYAGGTENAFVPHTFMHSFSSDLQRNMTTVKPSILSGSSDGGSYGGGGGGFSSGGGSSGGGMGGGGGRSW